MRLITSGESHGPGLTAIIEGVPSGFSPDISGINAVLSMRRSFYGRGARMKMETDSIVFTGGLVNGRTYGAPLSFFIKNNDDRSSDPRDRLAVPRPGHSDLPGTLKYGLDDFSIPSEFSGGRMTAVLTAAGELAGQFLLNFGINVLGFVTAVGNMETSLNLMNAGLPDIKNIAELSPLRLPDLSLEPGILKLIDDTADEGDTLGGKFVVIAEGLPPGLGSFSPLSRRLDSALASAIISLPGVKGVEIGDGFRSHLLKGSHFQDALYKSGSWLRKTNHAGGVEGGFSNGERILLTAVMKPLPSVKKGISSYNIESEIKCSTVYIRSDVCAVPAAALAAEKTVAFTVMELFLDKFSADTMDEVKLNFDRYMEKINYA